jgi:hypothetical protein
VRSARLLLFALAAFVLTVAARHGMTELTETVLLWAPLLVVAGLLLSGRFVGEERILARLSALAPKRRLAPRRRWSHLRDRALTSLLARGIRHLRGPPAPAAA